MLFNIKITFIFLIEFKSIFNVIHWESHEMKEIGWNII